MSRPWPVARVVREVVGRCRLDPSARIEGGDLIYADGVIRHTLSFGRDKHNKRLLGWSVTAADERYAWISVEIWRPDRDRGLLSGDPRKGYRYFWPRTGEEIGSDLLADIVRYGRHALAFVRDRRDLGELLLAGRDVHRGPVWARLGSGSAEGGRLVLALVLARDGGDEELERAALAKLANDGDRDVTWLPERPYLLREVVADIAARVAPRVDVDLSDLMVSGRRRRR